MKTFMQKLLLEWIPLARISFGLSLLINSISNMKQIPQHFFKDLEFSIKLSGVRANCSTLECQGQKKKQQQQQTNKQTAQNEPFSFTKVHNFKFFNNNSSSSLKIHFICLVK